MGGHPTEFNIKRAIGHHLVLPAIGLAS